MEDQVFHIRINGNSAARIIIKLNTYERLALIDTGASKCCMSEHQYISIGSPPLEPNERSQLHRLARRIEESM